MNRIPAQIACLLTCAANSSFEREFGIQDALAKVIGDKSNRAIRSGAVNPAGIMFLPI